MKQVKSASVQKFILFIFIFAFTSLLLGQNSECIDCHSDKGLKKQRGNQEVSLFVNNSDFQNSVHGNLQCVDCHTNFDAENIPHRDGRNIYKVNCTNCHSKYSILIKNDVHHRLNLESNKEKPGCETCHDYHYVQKPSKIKDKSEYYCSSCHSDTKTADGFHALKTVADEQCAECHDEVNEIRGKLKQSIHAELACSDCHQYVAQNLEIHEDYPEASKEANCGICHADVEKEHSESVHGISLSEGIEEAANCADCHGSHEIIPAKEESSPVNPKNVANTCGACHDNPEIIKKFDLSSLPPEKTYAHSIHGRMFASGKKDAPTCTTCHGVHNIKNRVQPDSKIASVNIPNTCENCHPKIVKEYENSIHWKQVQRGIKEAPVCVDCHSEHGIQDPRLGDERKNKEDLQNHTCIACHSDSKIAKRFGKEGGQVEAYLNSYHGLAVTRGDERAALCIDCHGVHSILPQKDSMSTISSKNVTQTCQKCHTNASEVFAKSYSHKTALKDARVIENVVRSVYFWLIIAVIGGMFVHNLIIFIFEIRKRRKKEKNVVGLPRFTKNEIIQHILLLTSFITLAITGFALRFPHSFWAEGLLSLGLTEPIRQVVHRTAAVIMGATGFYHIFYLFFTPRGRDVLYELLPRFDDLKQVIDNIMYYLHLSKKPPQFGQYDYAEKAEYWALIWGTFVMGATGFFLWFPTTVGDWAPVWLIKVSEIVHFYEAILASLAILVWHWFFVMYHPKEYPISFTWIDGKIPLHHYREHHERQFRRMMLEYYQYKSPEHDRKKLSNYTELFISTLEKSGITIDEIYSSELNRDPELRVWLDEELTKSKKENTTKK
jgi:predicted CXXCH cytochrome family protein